MQELTEGVVERNYGMGLVVSGDGTAVEVSGSRLVGNKSHGVFVRDGGRCVLRGTAVCGNGKNGVMAYMSGSSIYAKVKATLALCRRGHSRWGWPSSMGCTAL